MYMNTMASYFFSYMRNFHPRNNHLMLYKLMKQPCHSSVYLLSKEWYKMNWTLWQASTRSYNYNVYRSPMPTERFTCRQKQRKWTMQNIERNFVSLNRSQEDLSQYSWHQTIIIVPLYDIYYMEWKS